MAIILKLSNEDASKLGVTTLDELKSKLTAPVAVVAPVEPKAEASVVAVEAPQETPVVAVEAPVEPKAEAPVDTKPEDNSCNHGCPACCAKPKEEAVATSISEEAVAKVIEAKVQELNATFESRVQEATSKALTATASSLGVKPVAVAPEVASKDDIKAQYEALRKTDPLKASAFYKQNRKTLSPF